MLNQYLLQLLSISDMIKPKIAGSFFELTLLSAKLQTLNFGCRIYGLCLY